MIRHDLLIQNHSNQVSSQVNLIKTNHLAQQWLDEKAKLCQAMPPVSDLPKQVHQFE